MPSREQERTPINRYTMRDEERTRCEHSNGKWVRFSDHEAEVERLKAEGDRLREKVALKMDETDAAVLRAEAEATQQRAEKAEALLAEARSGLEAIAIRPLVERNPDGEDQASAAMRLIARETLKKLDSAPTTEQGETPG